MALRNAIWKCSFRNLNVSLNYVFKWKFKIVHFYCIFKHCAGAGPSASAGLVNRTRVSTTLLQCMVLLVISTSCLKTANALDYTKSFDMIDNTDKGSSGNTDYDDYGDSVEHSAETSQIMRQATDTPFNSYTNQTQTQARRIEPVEDNTSNNEETNPSEIQKAICTITAGEVKASAEAVTTKTLKGVCGSAELKLAVSNLEEKIFKELASIRALLLQQIATKEQQPTNCECETKKRVIENITSTSTMPSIAFLKPFVTKEKKLIQHSNNVETKLVDEENAVFPKLKSLQHQHQQQQPQSQSRDKEVSKFNNTMLADKDVKIFTYYWRLENFTERIESGHSVNIDSPRFAIKGKPLHLKAYFQHLHRDFLFVQLEYATVSTSTSTAKGSVPNRSGSSNNIILDMGLLGGGSLFKAISSNDQILFKYKISILDQQNLRSSKDLISQEFHNLEGGFLVPNSALLGSPYIKNDTLLIQLFLYL